MSRTVAQLAVEMGEVSALFAKIRPFVFGCDRWPQELIDRVRDLCAGSAGSGGWYVFEKDDAGVHQMRPLPKLLALMADIRAQNPQAETLHG